MEEIWKDVIGYEGHYQISSFGNVRSLDRYIVRPSDGVRIFKKAQLRSSSYNQDRYKFIRLNLDGLSKSFLVHVLVAKHFVPNIDPENLKEINHIDCQRDNNHFSNLEWCTRSFNVKYSFEVGGRSFKAENHPQSKLTQELSRDIRILRAEGWSVMSLVKFYSLSKTSIHRALSGEQWQSAL